MKYLTVSAQEEHGSPLPASKPVLVAPCPTPLYLSSEPSVSQQHRGRGSRWTQVDQDKVKLTSEKSLKVIRIFLSSFLFSFYALCYFKVAAPRPLPPLPTEGVIQEGRKKNRRSPESKVCGAATSTSVASCKGAFSAAPQVRMLQTIVHCIQLHHDTF